MPVLPTTAGGVSGTETFTWPVPVSDGSGQGGDSGLGEWSSLIGIVTAIVGNVLIALALNVQRYSHIQLHRKRVEARERAKEALKRDQSGHRNGYGAVDTSNPPASDHDDDDTATETHPLARSFESSGSNWTESSSDVPKVASTYLKSPSWWLGQVLMTVGEMGNFLAYGFAPASIVSPLGVVALISNCVIAPIFFGEIFRTQDFWGVLIAVGGAITVVLSAKGEETKLDPHGVWDAITTMEFEIYLGITTFLIIVLMWASPRYGSKTILIDLGLVGLFGGYTALTTKGVSSMLSSTLFKTFATPVTYGLVIVLLGTAVMQVRYVNKALQRFDSTQVIPIQFVLFTLSVIIGSAVLYRDFERTTAEQAAKFIGGCLLTFFGVFLITSGRLQRDSEDELSDDDNMEETIGLRDQEGFGSYNNGTEHAEDVSTQSISASDSGKSRTSQSSFSRDKKAFKTEQPKKASSNRRIDQVASDSVLPTSTGTSPSLLVNPWRNSVENHSLVHPNLSQPLLADSIPINHSIHSVAISEAMPSSSNDHAPRSQPSSPARPVTRPSTTLGSWPHGHHRNYSNHFISPSPLSSTVSAVVTDALLKGEDSSVKRRRSIRRLRPTLRSSIFGHNEDDGLGSLDSSSIPNSEGGHIPNEGEPRPTGREISRKRARSLSNTLGELFVRKGREPDSSNPETGGS